MSSQYTRWVGTEQLDIGEVGQKMGNLAKVAHCGLPVPPGFVITTKAFADFCSENALDRHLDLGRQWLFAE